MSSPLPPGRIKVLAEDFVVDEIPAYAPSGTGEHLFVHVRKTGLTTLDAVGAIARALECDAREAGFAGMKDKRAVTTQTLSLHAPRGTSAAALADRARSLQVEGIEVLSATPHPHKLKPGHLSGNRFAIVVRDVPLEAVRDDGAAPRALEQVRRQGVANAFGAQRFGFRGDNADRALAWLHGREPGPRDRRVMRLLWSSLQSAVFNRVLAERQSDGTWATPLEGDLLKLHASGGLFVCSDVQTDRERAVTGELSPTGPILGLHMRAPQGAPAELERRVAAEILGDGADLHKARALGDGTRRALRVWVEEMHWEVVSDAAQGGGGVTACVRVRFVLPKGAYATTVLAAAFSIAESRSDAES